MPSTRGRQLAGMSPEQAQAQSGKAGWQTCYVCGQIISGRGYDDQGKGRRHTDCEMDPSVQSTVKIYVASATVPPQATEKRKRDALG